MLKNIVIVGLFSAALLACSNNSMSQKEDSELSKPVAIRTMDRTETGALKQEENEIVEANALVESVDYDTRRMTVKDHNGDMATFTVSPEVQRLSEIEAGDRISVRFVRSLAFEVRPATEEEIANPRMAVTAEKKTELDLPPGMAVGALTHTIVTIQDVDMAANTVTVKLPEGNSVTIQARYPENLKRIKVGDTVAVTYGEAVAVAIQPLG